MAKSIRKEHKMPFVSHLLYSSVSLYGLVKIVLVYPTAYPCNDLTYNSKCVQRWNINCYSWQKLTVASIECVYIILSLLKPSMLCCMDNISLTSDHTHRP